MPKVNDKKDDVRQSELDISIHNQVPKWLEDMSKDVGHKSESTEDKTTDKFDFFSSNLFNGNTSLCKLIFNSDKNQDKSSESTPSTSAKHGRRANTDTSLTPRLTDNLDDYIVPKIDEIDFVEIALSEKKNFFDQYLKVLTKTVDRKKEGKKSELIALSNLSLPNSSSTSKLENEFISYSPSILETGRRSRTELSDTTFFSDLISVVNEIASNDNPINVFHSKSEEQFNLFDDISEIVTMDREVTQVIKKSVDIKLSTKKKPAKIDNKQNNDVENLLNYITTNNNTHKKVAFNDSIVIDNKNKLTKYAYHNKLINSPAKRTRYRKFKYKQGHAITSKRDTKPAETKNVYVDSSNVNKHVPILEDEIFIIPELPSGSTMIVDILSTWGDKYYIGLNGIELFGSDGKLVDVKQISAIDVNILPECKGDPRIAKNLLDGVNRTQDDMHLWLAPFDAGQHHLITIEFKRETELAMIRIWNYNKSRIHSFRGAKYIVITLDDKAVFKGEIAQASGTILGSIESFGDTILFSTDESILEKIALNDEAFTALISASNGCQTLERTERPMTANEENITKGRPYTQAIPQRRGQYENGQLLGVQKLDLIFILNWGKYGSIGLTGLEIIGEANTFIPVDIDNIRCNSGGPVEKLFDNENITTDPNHMWLVKYSSDEEAVLSIKFNSYIYIAGIRIWNYNENIEMSFSGVKFMKIYFDDKLFLNSVTNESTFMLRRAPGNIHYDYVQEILFAHREHDNKYDAVESVYNLNKPLTHREEFFEHPIMPEGFVFQIVVYTTWGDLYYVGLNGIELFDKNGYKISLTDDNICAYPESVNVLPNVTGDIRTPDKLIDGINESTDGSHAWLAPIIPKCLNRIYIVLDQPVTVSVIKLWNYFKTPSRGVKEFGILVDDLLVYNGILDKANEKSSVKYRSILFTTNADVIQKEMATLVKHSIDRQGTVLMNNEIRMTTGGSLPNVDQSLRPFTSVNNLIRGRSSQSN